MLTREGIVEIRVLARQGKSIREIAREVGTSRNTVRKYLRTHGEVTPTPRTGRVQKLDPYKAYIAERLRAAHPAWLPATALLPELRAQGYDGGLTRLRMFMRRLRVVKAEEPVIRFETGPGEQLQVDWVVFRRGAAALSAFVATLGYSRASFVEFVTDEKLDTLLACHEHAFEVFGGVPRAILYDNMKTVVLTRDAYGIGEHRFQGAFLDFAGHYGFVPKLCQPYRAKTKGKVERFNGYLRRSFYNPLASRLAPDRLLLDADTANTEVRRWLREVANARVHGTTGEVPRARLRAEQTHLLPLPEPWRGRLPARGIPQAARRYASPVFDATPLQHQLAVYDALLLEDR